MSVLTPKCAALNAVCATPTGNEQVFHPGWLLARALGPGRIGPNGADDTTDEDKSNAIDAIVEQARRVVESSAVYQGAVQRWIGLTSDERRFASATWPTATPVLIGTSAANALETGAALHQTYGVPYLPGSALKGCARAFAVELGVAPDYLDVMFGRSPLRRGDMQAEAGCVIFHDAWWLPPEDARTGGMHRGPLRRDVVTPHHHEYYAGKQAGPTDFDSPVPVATLAARGAYYFVVEGEPAWAQAALRLLRGALARNGIGAKRAAGYGLFITDPQHKACQDAQQATTRLRQRWQGAQRQARQRQLTPQERFCEAVRGVDAAALARKLSRDRTQWASELGVDIETLRELAARWVPAEIRSHWEAFKRQDKFARKAWNFVSGQGDQDGAD